MLPLALGYIIVIAATLLVLQALGVPPGWMQSLALFVLNLVLVVLVFFVLDRGRLVSPAASRLGAAELARLRRSSPAFHPQPGGGRLMAIGVKVLDRPIEQVSYVRATLKGLANTFQSPGGSAQGDHAVSRAALGSLAALAGHASHADHRDRQGEVRGLRSVPHRLPGELHQAGAGRGRGREPLSADLRDRRVPLHLLRLLPGSVSGGGDPPGPPLRERRVQPRAASSTTSSA